MVLRITNSTADFGITEQIVTLENFANKVYHPMIAATTWDKVYIDVTDETPRGYIMQLIKRSRVIPVFNKEEVTPRMLQVLCEILPDEAARLRATYMKDKWDFRKLIDELFEEYWRE